VITPPPSALSIYNKLINAWLKLRPTREEHASFVAQLSDIEAAQRKDPKKFIATCESLLALLPEQPEDRKLDWKAILTTDD
jgi:hypothetical protein